MTTKITIAECVRRGIIENQKKDAGNWTISFGDYGLLGRCVSIARENGLTLPKHPLDASSRVLTCVGASKMFSKLNMYRAMDSQGRSRLLRLFELREEYREL